MASTDQAIAELLRRKAEDMFLANDLAGATFQAHKASVLCSSLPGVQHTVAALDVLTAAATRKLPSGGTDWFAVLGVDPCADLGSAKKRFLALCLLVHPDKNPSAAAGQAFDVVKQAWDAVSASLASASTKTLPSASCDIPAGPCTHPQPTRAKKRAAPVNVGGGRRGTNGRVRTRCRHCHAEFSTWGTVHGSTVLMECPSCDEWVDVPPQQEEKTSRGKTSLATSSRPRKRRRF